MSCSFLSHFPFSLIYKCSIRRDISFLLVDLDFSQVLTFYLQRNGSSTDANSRNKPWWGTRISTPRRQARTYHWSFSRYNISLFSINSLYAFLIPPRHRSSNCSQSSQQRRLPNPKLHLPIFRSLLHSAL